MYQFVNIEVCQCSVGFITCIAFKWFENIHIVSHEMLSYQMLFKSIAANEIFIANVAMAFIPRCWFNFLIRRLRRRFIHWFHRVFQTGSGFWTQRRFNIWRFRLSQFVNSMPFCVGVENAHSKHVKLTQFLQASDTNTLRALISTFNLQNINSTWAHFLMILLDLPKFLGRRSAKHLLSALVSYHLNQRALTVPQRIRRIQIWT